MTEAFPIAVILTGLAGVAALVSSTLLERLLPRDGAVFKALIARRRRHVGRRRFWLQARYYLPWIAPPDLAGCDPRVGNFLRVARACGMLFVAGALAVLAMIARAAATLGSQ